MPARLNRRRYREAVSALKEIIANQKTPAQRRLRAVETLLSIYDRHDRSEERKESRKRSEAQTEAGAEAEAATTMKPETAEGAAARFIDEMRQKGRNEQ